MPFCVRVPANRFNYRSTHYMAEHGFYDFINWFDERSWYPLGRVVGGTVSWNGVYVMLVERFGPYSLSSSWTADAFGSFQLKEKKITSELFNLLLGNRYLFCRFILDSW